MVKIYYSSIKDIEVEKYFDLLPEIRKKRISKIMNDTHKKQSIGVWLLLLEAFKENHYKLNPTDFNYGNNGMPIINNCPLYFSISHSNEYAAIAISKEKIGIDIEFKKDINTDTTKLFLNDNDFSYFEAKRKTINCFYTIWTLKEAISKYIGLGIKADFKTIAIDYKTNKYKNVNLFTFNKPKNYVISVATEAASITCIKNIKL